MPLNFMMDFMMLRRLWVVTIGAARTQQQKGSLEPPHSASKYDEFS
jgi:hypothetical protein